MLLSDKVGGTGELLPQDLYSEEITNCAFLAYVYMYICTYIEKERERERERERGKEKSTVYEDN